MLLEWPEHSNKIIEGVNMLHSELGAFTDVTLSAEGKQIKAHRVILASASTYFKELLLSESQTEDRFPIVFLKDVKFVDLQCLLKYIYTGKTQISATNMPSCTQLAQTLGISGFSEKILKSPKKRQSLEQKENQSPLKYSTSEPVPMADPEEVQESAKRRKIHSMDNPSEVLSPPIAFKSSVSTSTVVIKSPSGTPVKRKPQHLSCPVDPEPSSSPQTPSTSNYFPRATMLNHNFSFDSTYASMNPEELAFRGANILQTLAMWMLEEQKNKKSNSNSAENLTQKVEPKEKVTPPAPPNSLKSNPGISNSNSKRRTGESESGDRPDSGFDSKDEDEVKISTILTSVNSETISEEAGVRTASSEDTSPEIAISRQAPIRQPVMRKRRLNN